MALAVPHVGGNTNTGSDTITSDSWTSTGGSLIVVIGHTFNQTSVFANGDVTDSKGNSYTLAAGANGGSLVSGIGVWYNNGGTRGATHTVTFNPGGTGQSVNIAVIEVTGQDASAPFDTTTDATASDGTSPYTVTAAAAISGNQIAITGCTIDTGSNKAWTNPTGYTDIKEEGNGAAFLVSGAWYKINETGTPAPGASSTHSVANARQVFVSFKEASVSAFSLDAQPASYAVSGAVAGVVSARALNASPGSYAFTGTLAGLLAGRVLNASPGSYAFTGAQAELLAARLLSGDPGAYVITGFDADLVFGTPTVFELDAQPGFFFVSTGTNEIRTITISDTAGAPVNSGEFTMTFKGETTVGVDCTLQDAAVTQAALEGLSNINPGDVLVTNVTLSGSEQTKQTIEFRGQWGDQDIPTADFTVNTGTMDDATISVANTQQGSSFNAALLADRVLGASPGSYAVDGAVLAAVAARLFGVDPGSYTVSGAALTALANRVLAADPGDYVLTGRAAGLEWSGAVQAAVARLRTLMGMGT